MYAIRSYYGKAIAIYQDLDVMGDENFELSASLRVDELEQAVVVFYVDFYNESGAYIEGKFIEHSSTTSDYITLFGKDQIPSNAVGAAVYVLIEGVETDGFGTIYIDDLVFKTNSPALNLKNMKSTVDSLFKDFFIETRITSYNVCYTKLLR